MNLNIISLTYIWLKYIILAIVYLLCIPAVFFISEFNLWLPYLLTWGFIAVIPILLIIFRKKKFTYFVILACCILFLVIFYFIPPSNNRNWTKDVAILPSVSININLVTVKNIRNFQYKSESDYIPEYYNKTFNADNIISLDYILSYWDGNTNIAHTMFSFGFKDNSYLCVSVETRREVNELQTGLRGLYNQYESIYILADEKDLLGLRTNFRQEEVFVYPIKAETKKIKKLFLQIMHKVQNLETKPQFYNTIKNNCFTSILNNVSKITEKSIIFDYRFILSGYSDELGYEKGLFLTEGMSFKDFKNIHHINQYVHEGKIPDNYSSIIRNIK
jgi:hypothetical protein